MDRMTIVFVLFAGSCASPLFAACQGPAPAGNLLQQLQATYVPTLMDPTGIKVAQPGCTLVVQLDGIAACPSTKTGARSVYENQQVSPETKNGTVNKIKRGIGRLPGIPGAPSAPAVPDVPTCGPTQTARNYMVGEKVYLTSMEVRNTGNDTGLIFSLQSCGTCDPSAADPSHTPYKAELRISLLKNFLTASDLKQIEKVVAGVLAFPDDSGNGDKQQVSQNDQGGGAAPAPPPAQQQAAPAQTFAPIAPPPPPPADTPAPAPPADMTGQTPDQVKAALGNPSSVVKAGNKQIYTYKNLSLKIVFTDGKVTDVE
jgi:hypothetical protein